MAALSSPSSLDADPTSMPPPSVFIPSCRLRRNFNVQDGAKQVGPLFFVCLFVCL
ncbi:hypothetical protein Hanom_Chr02g00134091 [Helianthus anomalus]